MQKTDLECFKELWNALPKELPYLQKLVILDARACYDVYVHMVSETEVDLRWFYNLMTVLTKLYIEKVPSLLNFEYMPDIAIVHANGYNSDTLEDSFKRIQQRTERYLNYRHELRNFIESNSY